VLAFSNLTKEDAGEDYKFALLVWAIKSAFGGGNPPNLPDILKEG
jgi:hypothetical protein